MTSYSDSTTTTDSTLPILTGKQSKSCFLRGYYLPFLVSIMAIIFTLVLTFSVLFWNYSETEHRKMTKKQGLVLDHWGRKAPSVIDPDLLLGMGGGEVLEGETILGRSGFYGTPDEIEKQIIEEKKEENAEDGEEWPDTTKNRNYTQKKDFDRW